MSPIILKQGQQIRSLYLKAHLIRTKALKALKKAKHNPIALAHAKAELDRAQHILQKVQKKHEHFLNKIPLEILPWVQPSEQEQLLIARSEQAYNSYQQDIHTVAEKTKKSKRDKTRVKKEPKRFQKAKKNREALSSALAKTRQEQRARAKSVAHREYRANYVLSHRFYVEMDGVIRAAFNECSGFGLDIKKELYLEGGVNEQQRVMLGHAEFQDTVLKRGMTNDPSFWAWMHEVLVGRTLTATGKRHSSSTVVRTRRNINILMMNQAGAIMQVCTLVGAIPIGWKAPAFQSDSATVAIEEMTVAYEGIHLQFQTEAETLAAGGASTLLLRDELGFFPEN
ncbi:MAG: phage tail protein [Cyanobacteria bacterium P01_D01_bin.156]